MPDFGPHNAECATADGGTCYCDCHGAMHGIKATAGKSGNALTRHMGDVQVTKRSGGGYSVIDGKTGRPPGGGTQREKAIAARMGDVEIKPRFADPTRELPPTLARKVAKVRAGLPKTKDGWNAHIRDSNASTADYFEKQAKRHRVALAEREADYERKKGWWEHDHRAAFEADPAFKSKAKRDEFLDNLHKQWGGESIDYLRKTAAEEEAEAAKHRAAAPNRVFGWDANNAHKVTPDEWNAHLKDVMGVGKATLNHHRETLDADPEYNRLSNRAAELRTDEYAAWKASSRAETWDEKEPLMRRKQALQAELREAEGDLARYDQQALLATLKAARPFGGGRIADDVTPLEADGADLGASGMRERPARSDWQDMLRTAEGFYPDDWLAHSREYGPLTVGASPRAFHRDHGPGKGSMLMMPTEDVSVRYSGAHGPHGSAAKDDNRGYAQDVTVHEMGHRMERSVPGLTHLEMAFVRKRSTDRKGAVEDPKSLGYADTSEVAFHDKWKDAYAGRTYESRGGNPGEVSWEVFQVGMQDTFSRTKLFDEGDELQQFVIGALLTLA